MDEWQKLDLHIHTQQGKTYNNSAEVSDIGKFYSLINFYARNKKNNLNLVSITNHNIINAIELIKIAYISKYTNTKVLPGVELDIKIKSEKRYHIIVIFSESIDIIKIIRKLDEKIKKNSNGKTYNFLNLDELFDLIHNTECILIPHACKKQGLKPTESDDVNLMDAENLLNIITSSSCVNVLFEHTQPYNKKSFKDNIISRATNWFTVEEVEELRNKIETSYTASDYKFQVDPKDEKIRKLPKIWATSTFRGLQLSCLFSKNRIEMEDNIISKTNYIKNIVIKGNDNFEDSNIELSSGLNSIIGESASGKTALLDIITTNLNDEQAVEGKDYKDVCKGLEIKFYNQLGMELKQDDINIKIAQNLYKAINTAHETKNNADILKLFNFEIKEKSLMLNKYALKIENVANYYKESINSKNSLITNMNNITERTKALIKNTDGKLNKLIINLPDISVSEEFKTAKEAHDELKNYKELLSQLKTSYDKMKYKLQSLKIDNTIETNMKNLESEILRIEKIVVQKGFIIKYRDTVSSKLKTIINTFNDKINVKSSFIIKEKEKLANEIIELNKNLKAYYINNNNYNMEDICFPEKEIINELKEGNKHDYVMVEYDNLDEILKVTDETGIINVKGSLKTVEKYRDQIIKNSMGLKEIITKMIDAGKTVKANRDQILENIISNSQIKLGYPNSEKIDIEKLSPGQTAKLYIDYMFNVEIENDVNNIVVFDQPENDVDKEFIYNNLIDKFNSTKQKLQIIITSHEPLLVVNADSNQVIKAEKVNRKMKYTSYKLDEYIEIEGKEKSITSLISKYVDGDINAVKNRYEIYVGGRN